MNMKTFLRLLEGTPREWAVYAPVGFLRTTDEGRCPIIDVGYRLGVSDACVGPWFVGQQLKLSRRHVKRIVLASDNRRYPRLRKKLLKACGVKPKDEWR